METFWEYSLGIYHLAYEKHTKNTQIKKIYSTVIFYSALLIIFSHLQELRIHLITIAVLL